MDECFKCGITSDKALLFDTITLSGIQKVCRKCSFDIDSPLIQKPSQKRLRESQMKKSVYEKLSCAAGLNPDDHRKRLLMNSQHENVENVQDRDLKALMQRNLKNMEKMKSDKYIENFHWIIMRVRRSKKITQSELAKEVGEAVELIQALEKGILPRGHETISKKIGNFLGINLFQDEGPKIDKSHEQYKKEILERIEVSPDEVLFDRNNPEQLTIHDLKEIKKEVDFKPNPKVFEKPQEPTLIIHGEEMKLPEEKIDIRDEPEFIYDNSHFSELDEEIEQTIQERLSQNPEKEFIGEPVNAEEEEKKDKKDLTDEEINNLIFGKK